MKKIVRRTVIIGLGGTGLLSLLNTKKSLYQYYGQIPAVVKFLALDTTPSRRKSLSLLHEGKKRMKIEMEPYEFLYLSVDNPLGVIKADPSIQRRWPEGIPIKAIKHGAGAIRALGNLAFYAHASTIMHRMDDLLDPLFDMGLAKGELAKQGLQLNEDVGVEIYIVGSLAGGTGSGCFIETAFMMRELSRGRVSNIYGSLILPWIFKGLQGTGRINANAYAALKELDYYMDFDYTRGRPLFVFGKEEVRAESPPYDIVNLIDGRNENGLNVKGSGAEKGIENLCELIGMGIALNVGSLGMTGSDVLANVSNIIVDQTAKDWGGKNPHYSSCGVSSIVYPMEKHYNRAYSLYSFLLIEDGVSKVSKEKSLEIDSDVVEKDVRDFTSNTANLNDEVDQVIDSLIRPGEIDNGVVLPPKPSSVEELRMLAQNEKSRVEAAIKAKLDTALPGKEKTSLDSLTQTLESREKKQSPAYALRFISTFIALMESYRKKRSDEKQRMEEELKDKEAEAEQILERVKEGGFWKRKGRIYQDYQNHISSLLATMIEVKRREASLKLFDLLIDKGEKYIEAMNLPEIEKKLFKVKKMIYEEMFTTTLLYREYGEYTILEEPYRIIVKEGPEGKIKTKVTAARKSWDDFGEFLKERKIEISFSKFLEESEFTFEQLSGMKEEELKEKLIFYSQEQVNFVRDMPIEDVLLFEVEETKQKEKLKEKLREASLRATPLWWHEVRGERQGLMQELFIIGVCDAENTKFKTKDYGIELLPYLSTQDMRYPANFTSTGDPYKIFFFKYKLPLPAYLLHDMERYGEEYYNMLVSMTPHAEREIELKILDLFPHTSVEEQCLRVFTLATSSLCEPALIKIRGEQRGNEFVEIYYVEDERLVEGGEEILGESKFLVLREFGQERKKNLRKKMIETLKKNIVEDPARAKQKLETHLKKREEEFEEKKEKFSAQPDKSSLTVGEKILMKKQIDILREFIQFKGNLEDFLDKALTR